MIEFDFYTTIVLSVIFIALISFIFVIKIHGEITHEKAFEIAMFVIAINSLGALCFSLLTEKEAITGLPQLYASLFIGGVMEVFIIYTCFQKLFSTSSASSKGDYGYEDNIRVK